MKTNILYELALGNISSHSRPTARPADHARARKTFADSEELLVSSLSDYQRSILKDIIDAQAELSLLTEVEQFVGGLSIGLLIMAEAHQNSDTLLANKKVA